MIAWLIVLNCGPTFFFLTEICERKKFLLQLLVNCLMEWTHYSPLLCKVLGKANVPQFLTSTLQSYFRSEPPSPVYTLNV